MTHQKDDTFYVNIGTYKFLPFSCPQYASDTAQEESQNNQVAPPATSSRVFCRIYIYIRNNSARIDAIDAHESEPLELNDISHFIDNSCLANALIRLVRRTHHHRDVFIRHPMEDLVPRLLAGRAPRLVGAADASCYQRFDACDLDIVQVLEP